MENAGYTCPDCGKGVTLDTYEWECTECGAKGSIFCLITPEYGRLASEDKDPYPQVRERVDTLLEKERSAKFLGVPKEGSEFFKAWPLFVDYCRERMLRGKVISIGSKVQVLMMVYFGGDNKYRMPFRDPHYEIWNYFSRHNIKEPFVVTSREDADGLERGDRTAILNCLGTALDFLVEKEYLCLDGKLIEMDSICRTELRDVLDGSGGKKGAALWKEGLKRAKTGSLVCR